MTIFNQPYPQWVVCLVSLISSLFLASSLNAATLLPYRAEYSLELVSALPETNIVNADGMMRSEISDRCEVWASSEEFYLYLRNTEGDIQLFCYKIKQLRN